MASSINHPLDKRRRIEASLLSINGVTRAGISEILRTLHSNGVLHSLMQSDSTHSASWNLRKTEKQETVELSTPYGAVVQDMQLPSGHNWTFVNPFAFLYHLSSISDTLGDILFELMHAGRPLRIILFMDAFTPGNPLRPDKGRSVQAIYWSIAELPDYILKRCDGWFLFGCLRNTIVDKQPAGQSLSLIHI